MDNMKRCPFCLDEKPVFEEDERTGGWRVLCLHCGAYGPWAAKQEQARLAWETRFHGETHILHTQSKLIKQCESCGSFFLDLGCHWLAPVSYCPACGAKVTRD